MPKGDHLFVRDLVLPEGYHLVIQPGAAIQLGAGVSIVSRCGLTATSHETEMITFKAINPNKLFGVIGVQGCATGNVKIANMLVAGGSEAWVGGAFYSGALSIYNASSVDITGLQVIDSVMDDGLNIKNVL